MGSSKKHKKDRDSSVSSKSKSKHKDKLRAPSPPDIRSEFVGAASAAGSGNGRERERERGDRTERVAERDRGERERGDRDRERVDRERIDRERIDRERSDRERERERERRHRENKSRDAERSSASVGDRRRERERSRERHLSQQQHRRPPVGVGFGSNTTTNIDVCDSDDSDVVEVPIAPPAPVISATAATVPKPSGAGSSSSGARNVPPPPPKQRSASPIPENGAGDCLSIAETNRLRAKLGLKPLDVGGPPSASAASTDDASTSSPAPRDPAHAHLTQHKDEWGEFLHKPADNIANKLQADKLREKIRQRKERRQHEERLQRVRKLGDEDETDDINVWLDRSRDKERDRAEAARRAAAQAEMDDQMDGDGGNNEVEKRAKAKAYTDRHLKGLKVDHDVTSFGEGKTVILTLKDQDVLNDEEGDTLVNVNMVDDERYKKNVSNKKLNPNSYGYDVYEEQYDHFGNPIERNILGKYDDVDGNGDAAKSKHFTIGDRPEESGAKQRRLQEIKSKLAGRRLESLDEVLIRPASDTYTVDEMAAMFKKPKKKKMVKKLRQKLKPEDLMPLAGQNLDAAVNFGRRQRREDDDEVDTVDDVKHHANDLSDVKVEQEDEDLEFILAKARRLKQREALIVKSLTADETEIKMEAADEEMAVDGVAFDGGARDSNIVLNATAEFCRTLGDIPTYGMSGNRDQDAADMMDDGGSDNDDMETDLQAASARAAAAADEERSTGTWNSVNPDVVEIVADEDVVPEVRSGRGGGAANDAILGEEPDVSSGMAAALKLAVSKGYLEKEDQNRPSNTRMAHLQAKNYSIDDKAYGDDEKFQRRDRFQHGPISDFKEKEGYRPNVNLEYIDDSGHVLDEKEAFRYLSHKFHGKGPGKNKIEKRLKKNEMDGVSFRCGHSVCE